LNSRERIWRAMEFEEPDRVPITELGIDLPHIESITGGRYGGGVVAAALTLEVESRGEDLIELTVKCYKKLKFDMIEGNVSPPKDWKSKINPDGTMIDEWGRVLFNDQKCKRWIPGTKTLFNSPEDWENLGFPDPHAPGRSSGLECMRRLVDGKMVLCGGVRDPFALLWEMFTPINFVKWMYQEPSFIRKMLEKVTVYNLEIIGLLADFDVEVVISSGDWCEKMGPMVPLKFFREVIFPSLRRHVGVAHSRGLKFIKHTDGNIMPLAEDVSSIVDGLHSLDPSAGVDIGELKRRYDGKLVLLGNVSVDNLARKSKEEVIKETKECIRKASPGGGHILTSSNTWFMDAKLENCLAVVEAGKKFGTYAKRC